MKLNREKLIVLIGFVIQSCLLIGQVGSNLDQGTGNIMKWNKTDSTLNILTQNSKIEIKPYSPQIIRIRVTIDKIFDKDFSFATVVSPQKLKWSLEDMKDKLLVRTDSLLIEINKMPFRLSYFNKNHKEIVKNDDFGHYYSGNELTCYNSLYNDEKFIGLGEKTGNLNRRGQGYTNWNTDHFGYGTESDPLYSSIPFYIGIHDSLVYGIFLDQTTKSHFNFGASNTRFSSFSVEAREIKYFYIAGSDVPSLIKNYTWLTGRTPMPPKWSLGYHQSRWSYFPDKEVIRLAETFREKDIPLDVIHLDIHYMDEYKIFTWNSTRFPDPKKMVGELSNLGVKLTLIVDPGIKVDTSYGSYKMGLKDNLFLKYPDGSTYSGSVWPGLCHFPDFTKAATRNWWGKSFKVYTDIGILGFWNDMNEPATWGQRFPSLVKFDFEGNTKSTIDGRNVYGMQMSRATYEGAKSLTNMRPFVLSRAGFSGIQRYSALWTGDNVATEDHLLLGVRLVNSLGVSGITFCGTDVGGFSGETTNSLYATWLSIGAFTPFFRGHKMINMRDNEPWSYGEEIEEIARNYIKLRYKLMPYLYSSFHESNETGLPVARTLAIERPFDNQVYRSEFQNQFMFGPSLLVIPHKSTDATTEVYFPSGSWYNLYNDKMTKGGKSEIVSSPIYKLPVFVKASAIIPGQKSLQSLSSGTIDTLDIHVYWGANKNEFALYEDDGKSFQFENKQFYNRTIVFDPKNKILTFGEVLGEFKPSYKTLRLLLHHFDQGNTYQTNGQNTEATSTQFSWLDKYSHLYYAPNENVSLEGIILQDNRNPIKITW